MQTFMRESKNWGIHLIGWGLLPFGLVLFTLRILLFHLPSLRRADSIEESTAIAGTERMSGFHFERSKNVTW